MRKFGVLILFLIVLTAFTNKAYEEAMETAYAVTLEKQDYEKAEASFSKAKEEEKIQMNLNKGK